MPNAFLSNVRAAPARGESGFIWREVRPPNREQLAARAEDRPGQKKLPIPSDGRLRRTFRPEKRDSCPPSLDSTDLYREKLWREPVKHLRLPNRRTPDAANKG